MARSAQQRTAPVARFPRLVAAGVGFALVAVVSGCSGDDTSKLSADNFRPGICRQAADSVISVDTGVQQLKHQDKKPADVVAELKKDQTQLLKYEDKADADLDGKLTALTDAIGAFRANVDANTAGSQITNIMADAVTAVAQACRAK